MFEFYLASTNPHKARELTALFASKIITLKLPPHSLEVEESGASYMENAFLKAQAYYQLLKQPVLADDSGLHVDALPGELGVHSARFGGGGPGPGQQAEQLELLLQKMSTVPMAARTAHFTCVLCLLFGPEEIYFFEGRLAGHIAQEIRGQDGFGYDPLFLPELLPSQTLAEMPDWKQGHSHRVLAAREAEKFLQERVAKGPLCKL